MTLEEKRKEKLEQALYDYLNTIEETENKIIQLIDGQCTKHDIISTLSKHKYKFQRLQYYIKKF